MRFGSISADYELVVDGDLRGIVGDLVRTVARLSADVDTLKAKKEKADPPVPPHPKDSAKP